MKVLCFGEILFDKFGKEKKIGGAPYNLASHLAAFGVDVYLLSALGKDDAGSEALDIVKDAKIHDELIKENDFPTGLVEVELDSWGVPRYDILPERAYDYIELADSDMRSIASLELDCLCFGTLARRNKVSARSFCDLLEKIDPRYRFCDLNLREGNYNLELIEESLRVCNILKLNAEEALRLKNAFSFEDESGKMWERLNKDYGIKVLIITRGKNEVTAFSRDANIHITGKKIKPSNTVGAGDAFSAAFIYHFLGGKELEEAVKDADDYARSYLENDSDSF